jgi:hypothetical protein
MVAKSVDDFFRKVYGMPAWNVQPGYGTFVTFEFGSPHLVVDEPIKSKAKSARVRKNLARRRVRVYGDWHLWIYCCAWRIYQRRTLLAHWAQSREKTSRAIEALDGQRLLRVRVNSNTARSEFIFDLGGRLVTEPYDDDPSTEQWMFYPRKGAGLTLRATGEYSCPSGSTKRGERTWHRFAKPRTK